MGGYEQGSVVWWHRVSVCTANCRDTGILSSAICPADLPKDGGRFDLPIAVGILAASEQIPTTALEQQEFVGELALSGELRPVEGVLTAALASTQSQRALFVALANGPESSLPQNAKVFACHSLQQLCSHCLSVFFFREGFTFLNWWRSGASVQIPFAQPLRVDNNS
ncbi:magnesium chelatase domain-containing protein [Ketobacter nezhaii]|uniref:magnesium chelatase domain-containing protein n=1 Tax=Ketobacter sp. MCCC 1A13808 TaxID=2602738 RepID=UPI0012EBBF14